MTKGKSKRLPDFHTWLTAKMEAACRDLLVDEDGKAMVPVMKARLPVFEARRNRTADVNKLDEMTIGTITRKAEDQQLADPSDPFVRNRVASHLKGGLCHSSDYGVDFQEKRVPFINHEGKEDVRRVKTPIRMYRP